MEGRPGFRDPQRGVAATSARRRSRRRLRPRSCCIRSERVLRSCVKCGRDASVAGVVAKATRTAARRPASEARSVSMRRDPRRHPALLNDRCAGLRPLVPHLSCPPDRDTAAAMVRGTSHRRSRAMRRRTTMGGGRSADSDRSPSGHTARRCGPRSASACGGLWNLSRFLRPTPLPSRSFFFRLWAPERLSFRADPIAVAPLRASGLNAARCCSRSGPSSAVSATSAVHLLNLGRPTRARLVRLPLTSTSERCGDAVATSSPASLERVERRHANPQLDRGVHRGSRQIQCIDAYRSAVGIRRLQQPHGVLPLPDGDVPPSFSVSRPSRVRRIAGTTSNTRRMGRPSSRRARGRSRVHRNESICNRAPANDRQPWRDRRLRLHRPPLRARPSASGSQSQGDGSMYYFLRVSTPARRTRTPHAPLSISAIRTTQGAAPAGSRPPW